MNSMTPLVRRCLEVRDHKPSAKTRSTINSHQIIQTVISLDEVIKRMSNVTMLNFFSLMEKYGLMLNLMAASCLSRCWTELTDAAGIDVQWSLVLSC